MNSPIVPQLVFELEGVLIDRADSYENLVKDKFRRLPPLTLLNQYQHRSRVVTSRSFMEAETALKQIGVPDHMSLIAASSESVTGKGLYLNRLRYGGFYICANWAHGKDVVAKANQSGKRWTFIHYHGQSLLQLKQQVGVK